MKRLLERIGVDYLQWRALVRALVKMDLIPLMRALRGQEGLGMTARAILGLALMAITFGAFGLMPAFVIWTNPDLWMGGMFLSVQVASLVSFFLLNNHAAALVTGDDHLILGFRPVSSRTYFAVRVTVLLAHTLPVVTLFSVAPLLILAIRPDSSAAIVGAGVALMYASAIAMTLVLVSGYGWLLALAGPRRFAAVMVYAQLAAGLLTFGAMLALMDEGVRDVITHTALPRVWWVLALPPAWFGSYVEVARGHWGWLEIAAAGWSLLMLVILTGSLAGKLSLRYAGELARLATATAPASARSVWVPRFFSDESRATAILVRSQFRNDFKFRMGVLSILPVTLIYFLVGLRSDRGPLDPFLEFGSGGRSTMMVQLAVFFLPDMLRQSLVLSDAYRASWIFHTTPADLTRLVLSAKDVIAMLFLLPYVGVLAITFSVLFKHPGHALLHAAFLGWMSYIVLQLNVWFDPQLPFASARVATAGLDGRFGLRIVTMIVGMFFYMLITGVAYRTWTGMTMAAAFMALLTVGFNRLTRQRVEARASELKYSG